VGPLSLIIFFLGDFKIRKNDIGRVDIGLSLLLISGFVMIWSSTDVLLGLKDLFFISCYLFPILFFVTSGSISNDDLNLIFNIVALSFLISILGRDYTGFSFLDSKSPFESTESFVFGGFFLHFMMQKDKKRMIIALFFMFLSLKRIALLGVLAGAAVWLLPVVWNLLNRQRLLITIANTFFILFLYLLVYGYFDEFIASYTEKGVAEITLGRIGLYVGVLDNIGSNFFSFFAGAGAGSTYELVMEYDYYDKAGGNLHSDTLKVFYEYGVFVFLAFYTLLSCVKGKEALVLSVYIMCLLLTDNVLIYVSVMFYLLLLLKQAEIRHMESAGQ
jgi:hypothetical protein